MGSKHQFLASCVTQSPPHKRFDDIFNINYRLRGRVAKGVDTIDFMMLDVCGGGGGRVSNRQVAGQPKWSISKM